MTTAAKRGALYALLVWAAAQAILTIRIAYRSTGSDFLDTVPPAFLNPPADIWSNFPRSIRADSYLHGPTQFLTMLPLLFAGSMEAIEHVLFPLYGLLVLLAAWIMWRTFEKAAAGPVPWVPIVAATVAFPPVDSAWADGEFEIVILLAFAGLAYAAVQHRLATAGALLAYISLYKYLPLVAVPYLVWRRWWRSVVGFAVTAALILLLAHLVYGLEGFINNNLRAKALEQVTGLASPAFCSPTEMSVDEVPEMADSSIRHDLCAIGPLLWMPPQALYLVIVAATMGLFVFGGLRLERALVRPESTERWRRVLEIGIIATVSVTFFFTHYYYLSLLILPILALLVRFTAGERWWTPGLVLLAAAYVLLGCFLVRPGPVYRWTGIDLTWLASEMFALFAGEMIVLGLLLQQYVTLPITPAPGSRLPAPGV